MKLYDMAKVCRSKNAGPFQLTIDLMFDDPEKYRKLLNSKVFNPKNIAMLYQIGPETVTIKTFERILTVKVVMARKYSSGSPMDNDVYGSQQHFPLGDLEII